MDRLWPWWPDNDYICLTSLFFCLCNSFSQASGWKNQSGSIESAHCRAQWAAPPSPAITFSALGKGPPVWPARLLSRERTRGCGRTQPIWRLSSYCKNIRKPYFFVSTNAGRPYCTPSKNSMIPNDGHRGAVSWARDQRARTDDTCGPLLAADVTAAHVRVEQTKPARWPTVGGQISWEN